MSSPAKHVLIVLLWLAGCREGTPAAKDGAAGPPASNDCKTLGTYTNCGTCSQPLEDYCVGATSCELDRSRICTRIWFGADWTRGCGYLRVEYYGDVGDKVTEIWDEASGVMVYHWFNGKLSSGCLPAITVGTLPSCTDWTSACTADAG